MKKLSLLFVILFLLPSFLFAKVNLNTATEKQLTALKGIGVSKAKAILEYRKKSRFKTVEDVLRINGIGKNFLEKNRDNICAGNDCK